MSNPCMPLLAAIKGHAGPHVLHHAAVRVGRYHVHHAAHAAHPLAAAPPVPAGCPAPVTGTGTARILPQGPGTPFQVAPAPGTTAGGIPGSGTSGTVPGGYAWGGFPVPGGGIAGKAALAAGGVAAALLPAYFAQGPGASGNVPATGTGTSGTVDQGTTGASPGGDSVFVRTIDYGTPVTGGTDTLTILPGAYAGPPDAGPLPGPGQTAVPEPGSMLLLATGAILAILASKALHRRAS